MDKKKKNITLAYIMTVIQNVMFWSGPWLLYLLNYVDLSQATTLQAIAMATRVITEIPSGVIADLLGKRKTLLLSFMFSAAGEILMANSSQFLSFAIAHILLYTGYSLYSGTMDAFVYDTLVTDKSTKQYSKVLSKILAITTATLGITSIIGGFLYNIWIALPYFATGVAKLLGIIVAFFSDEPDVDTEKFTIMNFFKQTKQGFKHLSKKSMFQVAILIVSFGTFQTIGYEILDDALVISYGYSAFAIGILYGVLSIINLPFSLLYDKFSKKYKSFTLITVGAIILALNYLFSPCISVYVWTSLFLIRFIYMPIRTGAITEVINKRTPSKIRATTISTSELIKKIPFVLFSGFLGEAMDQIGVKNFSFWFGLVLLIVIIPQLIVFNRKKTKSM